MRPPVMQLKNLLALVIFVSLTVSSARAGTPTTTDGGVSISHYGILASVEAQAAGTRFELQLLSSGMGQYLLQAQIYGLRGADVVVEFRPLTGTRQPFTHILRDRVATETPVSMAGVRLAETINPDWGGRSIWLLNAKLTTVTGSVMGADDSQTISQELASNSAEFAPFAYLPMNATDPALCARLDFSSPTYIIGEVLRQRSDFHSCAAVVLKGMRDKELLRSAMGEKPAIWNEGFRTPDPNLARQASAALTELAQDANRRPKPAVPGDELPLPRAIHPREMEGLIEKLFARVEPVCVAMDSVLVSGTVFNIPEWPEALRALLGDIVELRYLTLNSPNGLVLQAQAARLVRILRVFDFLADRDIWLKEIADLLAQDSQSLFFEDGSSKNADIGGPSIVALRARLELMTTAQTNNLPELSASLNANPGHYALAAARLLTIVTPKNQLPRFGAQLDQGLTDAELSRLTELAPFAQGWKNPGRLGLCSAPETSGLIPRDGVVIQRSDATSDARYLAIRTAVPVTEDAILPLHHDLGSVILSAYGTEFIVDAAGGGGSAASAAAHSVVTVDGLELAPPALSSRMLPLSGWITNRMYDLAEVVTEMPREPSDNIDGSTTPGTFGLRRRALFVKNLIGDVRGDYWLFMDTLFLPAGPTRQARWKWQFSPQVTLESRGTQAIAAGGTGNVLRLATVDPGVTLSVIRGQGADSYGAVYGSGGVPIAADAAVFQMNAGGGGAINLATVAWPAPSRSAGVELRRGRDLRTRMPALLRVTLAPDRQDLLVWGNPQESITSDDLNLQVKADLAIFRIREGRIAAVGLVGVTNLALTDLQGNPWIIETASPAHLLLEIGLQTLRVSADAGGRDADITRFEVGKAVTRSPFKIRPGAYRDFVLQSVAPAD